MENVDLDKLKEHAAGIEKLIKEALPNENTATELAKLTEFKNFRMSLSQESDRGSVLMAAAFIEDKLGQLLESFFVDNKKVRERILKGNGPLATFSTKIDLAFLLGLIPENILNDLHKLRKIRNEFAHNASPLNFETPSIKDRTNSLSVLGTALLRDKTRLYFLRSMTTILTFINMKMESFDSCTIEKDFDVTSINEVLKKIESRVQKEPKI